MPLRRKKKTGIYIGNGQTVFVQKKPKSEKETRRFCRAERFFDSRNIVDARRKEKRVNEKNGEKRMWKKR